MHQLISTWKNFDSDQLPYLLPEEQETLPKRFLNDSHNNWNDYISDPDFWAPPDKRFHPSLLPIPFVGNLKNASVYLLMLNPGFGPHDYFGEYAVSEYREALKSNIRQQPNCSFLFLDPRYSWHGGYDYWHKKLQKSISEFADKTNISYGNAQCYFKSQIAALELVPYHSSKFALTKGVQNNLHSVKLNRSFVHDILIPRAKNSECLIIATRASKHWELPDDCKNIVTYTGAEARSAHLTPNSRGGKAILNFFLEKHL